MKTAISLPDGLFERAEHMAHRMHVSRSNLYALALKSFLEKQQKETVTQELNSIYATENSKTDSFVQAANNILLSSDTW
ncbi:MAG: hypothetical protein WCK49_08100 [Myxococcaceae bacterium]